MMEQLLGTKVVRNTVSTGKGRKRIVYEIATLGVRQEGSAKLEVSAPKEPGGGQAELF